MNRDIGGKAGQIHQGLESHPTIGIVSDNVHPDGDYRVKVKFPALPGTDTSYWCRIGTFGAGSGGKGGFFLPEVDDEVLVVFLNGDVNQGVIIGSLWNGKDKPAYGNKDAKSATDRYQKNDAKFLGKTEAKKNDIRSFSSRAGHELVFNDNADKPRVTLSSGQKHRIVLSDEDNQPTQIEIYDGKEENFILIDTKNKKITIKSEKGDIDILAPEGTVSIKAKNIKTETTEATSISAKGDLKEETTQGNVTIKAPQGTGEINTGSTLTVKGSTVNIN